MNTHDKIELPEPAGHYYEWDGPYGKRKFSTAPHNGRECNRAVAYFTEDQVVAAIETALQSPEVQALRKDAERWRKLLCMSKSELIDVLRRHEPCYRYKDPAKVYSLEEHIDAAMEKQAAD